MRRGARQIVLEIMKFQGLNCNMESGHGSEFDNYFHFADRIRQVLVPIVSKPSPKKAEVHTYPLQEEV